MMVKDTVLAFYRAFYQTLNDADSGAAGQNFLCGFNAVMMHPVLTPNFFVGTKLTAALLAMDHLRFSNDFGLSQHWLHCFDGESVQHILKANGYSSLLSCTFNVFTKGLRRPLNKGIALEWHPIIPSLHRNIYEEKTAAHSHHLPPPILRRIEQVLQRSGTVRYGLAFSGSQLIGALTSVSAGGVTLFVNAWADPDFRQQRVISTLFANGLDAVFATGQKAAFYWTLNDHIAVKGDASQRAVIYNASLAPEAPPHFL